MIAISVEYLTGVANLDGRAYGRHGRLEWPPHPDRLFMGLVAIGGKDRGALRWLAEQDPPSITAGEIKPRPTLKVFSPTNDKLREARNKERLLASGTLAEPVVTFAWSGDPPADVRAALGRIVGRLAYLGRSESMVRAWLASEIPTPTWIPGGDVMMRVPHAGRLDELVAAYEAEAFPQPAGWSGYRWARTPVGVIRGEWSIMWTFELSRAVDLRRTVELAQAVRRCVLGACPDPIPAWVSGHTPGGDQLRAAHLGIVPLAHVGHRHADGRILGVGITVPNSIDASEAARCLERFGVTENGGIVPVRVGDGVYVERVTSGRQTVLAERWTRPARRWGTVTPVALSRFPKRPPEAIEHLRREIELAGLPTPRRVEIRGSSPHRGGAHRVDDPRRRYRAHAVIEWENPVAGPIAIGGGRYIGLGFCAALQGES